MQHFFTQAANLWTKKVHPRLASFITFFGLLWLGVLALTIYLLANLSDEVLEKEAFAFDKAILLHIHQFATPALDTLMVSITRIGDPKMVVPITLACFAFLWWRRYRLEAKVFALFTQINTTVSLAATFSRTYA